LGTVLHFAHYVSATYPSAKQVLSRLKANFSVLFWFALDFSVLE